MFGPHKHRKTETVIINGGNMENEGSLVAAEDILSAIEAKDASALDSALKAHYELCEGMPEEEAAEEAPETPSLFG